MERIKKTKGGGINVTYYVVSTNENNVIEIDGIDELVGTTGEISDEIDYIIEGNIVSNETIKERWNNNNI